MRTAQGGAAGAKIQHSFTSAYGYKQTSNRPKSTSAYPPRADEISEKTDIGDFTSALGCKPVVINGSANVR